MVYLVYLAACLAGGAAAGNVCAREGSFWGLLSGLFYFLILFRGLLGHEPLVRP